MNKKLIAPILIAVLAIGGLSAWLLHKHNNNSNNTLTLYGNVDIRQVQLAFNSAERISKMLVREGTQVKKGQLLATLNTVSFRQQARKASAEAKAARIAARNAESNYQRARALVAQHFVAQEQADNARDAYDAAEAKLQAAEAALKVANNALADTSLYAPDDGIIQERILEVGDMASPQHPVYTLALTDPLWVRVYVQEGNLGKVRPGMLADVTTDSYPGKHYRAWLGYISPTAEFTPKSVETTEVRSSLVYQARVFVCNPQNELRLGMPATVTIALDQPATADSDHCKNP